MEKEPVEFVDGHNESESEDLKIRPLKDILNGSVLTRGLILKNLGFIIWLTFLGIVYIGNRYHAEKVARSMNSLQKEVKDLRAESITTAAELMYLSRQSVVIQMVKNNQLDLNESVQPPLKIEK